MYKVHQVRRRGRELSIPQGKMPQKARGDFASPYLTEWTGLPHMPAWTDRSSTRSRWPASQYCLRTCGRPTRPPDQPMQHLFPVTRLPDLPTDLWQAYQTAWPTDAAPIPGDPPPRPAYGPVAGLQDRLTDRCSTLPGHPPPRPAYGPVAGLPDRLTDRCSTLPGHPPPRPAYGPVHINRTTGICFRFDGVNCLRITVCQGGKHSV
jgi:hypothetical protein